MPLHAASYFAGVGTVVATVAIGFGCGVTLTNALFGESTRPPALMERRAADARAAAAPPAAAAPAPAASSEKPITAAAPAATANASAQAAAAQTSPTPEPQANATQAPEPSTPPVAQASRPEQSMGRYREKSHDYREPQGLTTQMG